MSMATVSLTCAHETLIPRGELGKPTSQTMQVMPRLRLHEEPSNQAPRSGQLNRERPESKAVKLAKRSNEADDTVSQDNNSQSPRSRTEQTQTGSTQYASASSNANLPPQSPLRSYLEGVRQNSPLRGNQRIRAVGVDPSYRREIHRQLSGSQDTRFTQFMPANQLGWFPGFETGNLSPAEIWDRTVNRVQLQAGPHLEHRPPRLRRRPVETRLTPQELLPDGRPNTATQTHERPNEPSSPSTSSLLRHSLVGRFRRRYAHSELRSSRSDSVPPPRAMVFDSHSLPRWHRLISAVRRMHQGNQGGRSRGSQQSGDTSRVHAYSSSRPASRLSSDRPSPGQRASSERQASQDREPSNQGQRSQEEIPRQSPFQSPQRQASQEPRSGQQRILNPPRSQRYDLRRADSGYNPGSLRHLTSPQVAEAPPSRAQPPGPEREGHSLETPAPPAVVTYSLVPEPNVQDRRRPGLRASLQPQSDTTQGTKARRTT